MCLERAMSIAEKLEASIATIVGEQDRALLTIQLVKLVYLADYLFYRHTARGITGLTYVWHHFGPYHSAVVQVANDLVNRGILAISVGYRADGEPYCLYRRNEPYKATALSDEEVRFIREVVKDYGGLPWRTLVEVSKRTEPFKQARQYDTLAFEASTEHLQIDRDLHLRENVVGEVAKLSKEIQAGRVAGVKLEDLEVEDAT